MSHVRANRIGPREQPRDAAKKRVWLIVGVVVAAFALGSLVGGLAVYITAEPIDEADAMATCREYVGRDLLTPGTAEYSDEVVTRGSKRRDVTLYHVSGTVEGSKRLGEKVRMHYRCTVKHTEDGWALHDVEIDEPAKSHPTG